MRKNAEEHGKREGEEEGQEKGKHGAVSPLFPVLGRFRDGGNGRRDEAVTEGRGETAEADRRACIEAVEGDGSLGIFPKKTDDDDAVRHA